MLMDPSDRMYFLRNNNENLASAWLAKKEVDTRFFGGDKEGAVRALNYLKDNFDNNTEVVEFIAYIENRFENFSKINSKFIGVILPLTENKKKFSMKVLRGIESGISETSDNTGDIS